MARNQLNLRLPHELLALIQSAADRAEKSLSAWVRDTLRSQARKELKK